MTGRALVRDILKDLPEKGGHVFFVENSVMGPRPSVILLSPEESAHLARARRMKTGQKVVLNDGIGLCAEAVIVSRSGKRVEVSVERYLETENDLLPVELVCAVIKGERMDWAVSKSAEMGVARIRPVYTEHTVVKKDVKKDAQRCRRWQVLCREALKQCRGNFMTTVDEPCAIERCVAGIPEDHAVIVMWEGEDATDIRNAWMARGERLPVSIIVGPEGGFSMAEIEMFREKGYSTASFGNRIFRSETAAIVSTFLFSQLIQGKMLK